MAENVSLNVGDLLTRVELLADDGSVVGYAYVNFENPRVLMRLKEFAEYFGNYDGGKTPAELDADMTDKFCYVFGYDCRATLFGVLSPSDRLNGEAVALHLVRELRKRFSDSIRLRAEKRAAAIARYTENKT